MKTNLFKRKKTVKGRQKDILVDENVLAKSFNLNKNLVTTNNLSPENAAGEREGGTPYSNLNDSLVMCSLNAHILALHETSLLSGIQYGTWNHTMEISKT